MNLQKELHNDNETHKLESISPLGQPIFIEKDIEEDDKTEDKTWKCIWEIFLKKFLESKEIEKVDIIKIFPLTYNRQWNKKKKF